MAKLLKCAILFTWTVLGLRTAAAASLSSKLAMPFDPGFDIFKVVQLAVALPSHSWEYGAACESLLELFDPDISVFGDAPFPVRTVTAGQSLSLAYASNKFQIGNGSNT